MPHPNDTLNGRLHAHELPEEAELRNSFGYWGMVERRMIRAELVSEGLDPTNTMLVEQRVVANHRNDISYKDYQETVLKPRWAAQAQAAFDAGETERGLSLSRAELEKLVEHFSGANDPVAISLSAKAAAALSNTKD